MTQSGFADLGFVEFVQNTSWVIPAVQSAHILAIGLLFATIFLVNLRRAGIFAQDVDVAEIEAGRLKLGIGVLALMAATGGLMVISEPDRTLGNALFYIKLGLVCFASFLTFVPSGPSPVITVKVRAYFALLTWALTIFAGRWIAYVI